MIKLTNMKNTQSGFIKTILLIIIVIAILIYFNISASEIVDWIKDLWDSIFH